MNSKLIALTKREDDLKFLSLVAQTAGLKLVQPETLEVGIQRIAAEEHPVVFVDASSREDYQRFEDAVQQSLGLFSAKISANRLHFLSSGDIYEVPYLVGSPIFGSYIHRNYLQSPDVGKHYGIILKASLKERSFGIETLVAPGTRVQTIRLESSTQKQEAVEVVRNYLVALKFQTRMATVIANAVDELIMNAIYDAPVDASGRQLYLVTSRNTPVALSGRAEVEVKVASDGEYVALTAIDHFGSLDKGRLLAAISRIYRQSEYKVRSAVAGAGLGLATVFHSGGSFHFASEQGVRTEVTVFFRKTENFREFKSQFRFISTQFYF
ncbi:MAG: hypothetical protein KGQ59_03095 [Bdellovibrionales bacterium]|nr:hypothetical protein [Bdellovibrionales bacterium]